MRRRESISTEGESGKSVILRQKVIAAAINRRDVRFLLVGVWNTLFGYAAFVVLESLFSHILRPPYVAYMTAMIFGQIIAILNAYAFHKFITFRSSARGWKMIAEFFRFSTTYALTFGFSLVLLPLLVEVFHFVPKTAGLMVVIACTGISYLGHSAFSFRTKGM